MIFVKGGEFNFGDFYDSTNTDALPLHLALVKDFRIGKYEITNAQYNFYLSQKDTFQENRNSNYLDEQPVTKVSWQEALDFCTFYGMRLPTEVEWEYAARSGGKNQVISGTESLNLTEDYAITKNSSFPAPNVVGSRKPNDLGIYDMSGNVFEWIGDFYQFYTKPDLLHDNERDAVRIIRGGSFYEREVANRTYWRVGTLKTIKANDIGFRCAESAN